MGESTLEWDKWQKVSTAQTSRTNAVCEDCGCKWTATLAEVPLTILIKDLDEYYKKLSRNLLEAVEPSMVLCVFRPSDRVFWDTEVTLSVVAPRQDTPYHWRINHKFIGPAAASGCQISIWKADQSSASKSDDLHIERNIITVKEEIKEELKEEDEIMVEDVDFDPLAGNRSNDPDDPDPDWTNSDTDTNDGHLPLISSISKPNPAIKRPSEDSESKITEFEHKRQCLNNRNYTQYGDIYKSDDNVEIQQTVGDFKANHTEDDNEPSNLSVIENHQHIKLEQIGSLDSIRPLRLITAPVLGFNGAITPTANQTITNDSSEQQPNDNLTCMPYNKTNSDARETTNQRNISVVPSTYATKMTPNAKNAYVIQKVPIDSQESSWDLFCRVCGLNSHTLKPIKNITRNILLWKTPGITIDSSNVICIHCLPNIMKYKEAYWRRKATGPPKSKHTAVEWDMANHCPVYKDGIPYRNQDDIDRTSNGCFKKVWCPISRDQDDPDRTSNGRFKNNKKSRRFKK